MKKPNLSIRKAAVLAGLPKDSPKTSFNKSDDGAVTVRYGNGEVILSVEMITEAGILSWKEVLTQRRDSKLCRICGHGERNKFGKCTRCMPSYQAEYYLKRTKPKRKRKKQ